MNDTIRKVLSLLDASGIPYRMAVHRPVFTLAEAAALHLEGGPCIARNLFLRDARGRRHFLVVLAGNHRADLHALRTQLGTSALSFASEERLSRFLGLSRGAVTPLGILNDESRSVEVILDRALADFPEIGVHPNDNTATVFLPPAALEALLLRHGNPVIWLGADLFPEAV